MSDERNNEARRHFLKGVLVGGGAAVAAIAAGGAIAAPDTRPKPATAPQAQPKGYHETAHVRDYYKTAQF